ncbi:MAG: polysaccharide deacetylase family protein [Planctomycetota bacterium]|nr:polysaccharide deacetylase family protein [Planctomycetota bacterium]
MRIPITMCHGISTGGDHPLTREHFDSLVSIARELEFESITYDDLAEWMADEKEIPERTIMFDFDHPVKSMRYEMHEVLDAHGYRGNLFINTGPLNEMYSKPLPPDDEREQATWEELNELVEFGWHIGAHTVTHPNLSQLFKEDPSGVKLRAELEECDATLKEKLGIEAKDFAFTGTSWSSAAEKEVMNRYRFGRLWIVGSIYQVDGDQMRYADLVGIEGEDEEDGGPPHAARYIAKDSNKYRLPSMELQRLVHDPGAFRAYLEGAL